MKKFIARQNTQISTPLIPETTPGYYLGPGLHSKQGLIKLVRQELKLLGPIKQEIEETLAKINDYANRIDITSAKRSEMRQLITELGQAHTALDQQLKIGTYLVNRH